jgi:hypothetical protein
VKRSSSTSSPAHFDKPERKEDDNQREARVQRTIDDFIDVHA